MATTTTKTVNVLARITFKDPARAGYVLYAVRSSDGTNLYHTTLINGRAVGCTCPARKPCYHMVQLEAYEVTFTAQLAEAEARLAETKVQEQTANERRIFAVNMAAFIDAVATEANKQRRERAPLTSNAGFQFMMPEQPQRKMSLETKIRYARQHGFIINLDNFEIEIYRPGASFSTVFNRNDPKQQAESIKYIDEWFAKQNGAERVAYRAYTMATPTRVQEHW